MRTRSPSRPVVGLLLAALLGGATFVAYAPVRSAGFVDIDDADYVTENDAVKAGLRADGVAWAFGAAHAGNWIPLTWISHMLDVDLFGMDPARHHAVSLAIHVMNTVVLFALLAALTGEAVPSLLAAGVFGLHPINVESVAWIAQRKSTLTTFFAIGAIGGYARWTRTGSRVAWGGSLVCYALSLLAKQTFVPLPFCLLLLDYWPLRRSVFDAGGPAPPRLGAITRGWLRLLPEKLPYALLAIAASAAAVVAQGEAIAKGATYPLGVRLGNAVIAVVRYVEAILWPSGLSVFHPIYEDTVTVARVAVCATLVLGATAAAFGWGRRRRWLLVGWLWFLAMLGPVIGVVQIGTQSMADRYAYVPCWGIALASIWTVWDLARTRTARAAFTFAGVLVLAVLALATQRRAAVWHDSIALFEAAVAVDDRNYVAHRALAGQYFNRGDYWLARRHAEAGLREPRDLGEVLPIYGMALYQTGEKQRAIEQLREATRIAPDEVIAFTNLGWVYTQEKRDDLAAASFEQAVVLDPRNFDARIEWARALARLGRADRSAAVLADAIASAQAFPVAQRDRLLSTLHLYRGDALALAARIPDAIGEYQLSLASGSDNYAANVNLAALLATASDPAHRDAARAVSLAEHAVTLRRGPASLATLAKAYDAAGRRDDALRTAQESLELARASGDAAAAAAAEAQLRAFGAPAHADRR